MRENIKLLLVEDSLADADLLRSQVSTLPKSIYEIIHATTCAEASKILEKQKFDCIVLDIGLPDMNGLEFLALLGEKNLMMPVVMLTGDLTENIDQKAIQLGATDFINKNELNAEIFDHTIKYAIERNIEIVRLKDLVKIKEEFLSNVFNELKKPLNTLVSIIESSFHDENGLSQAHLHDLIVYVEKSAKEHCENIDRLFVSSIIGYEQLKLTLSKFDLIETTQSSIDKYKQLAQSKNISIEFDHHEEFLEVFLDKKKVEEVFNELIVNAIKFMEKGKILIELRAGEHHVRISFQDSGIGMTETQLSKIFIPFTQGDSTIRRRYGGVGAGLTIVKKYIEILNGSIEVESTLMKGSKFTLFLPIQFTKKHNNEQLELSANLN